MYCFRAYLFGNQHFCIARNLLFCYHFLRKPVERWFKALALIKLINFRVVNKVSFQDYYQFLRLINAKSIVKALSHEELKFFLHKSNKIRCISKHGKYSIHVPNPPFHHAKDTKSLLSSQKIPLKLGICYTPGYTK